MVASDLLEDTGKMSQERGRPAVLYRSKTQKKHFFVRNIEGGTDDLFSRFRYCNVRLKKLLKYNEPYKA